MSFLSRIMVLKSQAHFSSGVYNRFGGPSGSIPLEGSRKKKAGQAKSRVGLLILCFTALYGVIGGRLVEYAMKDQEIVSSILPPDRLMSPSSPRSHRRISATSRASRKSPPPRPRSSKVWCRAAMSFSTEIVFAE